MYLGKILKRVDSFNICTVGTIEQFHTFHSLLQRSSSLIALCCIKEHLFHHSSLITFSLSEFRPDFTGHFLRLKLKQTAEPRARWGDYCRTLSFKKHYHLPFSPFQSKPAFPPLISFCLCVSAVCVKSCQGIGFTSLWMALCHAFTSAANSVVYVRVCTRMHICHVSHHNSLSPSTLPQFTSYLSDQAGGGAHGVLQLHSSWVWGNQPQVI